MRLQIRVMTHLLHSAMVMAVLCVFDPLAIAFLTAQVRPHLFI